MRDADLRRLDDRGRGIRSVIRARDDLPLGPVVRLMIMRDLTRTRSTTSS
jgi:hypothetical protein